MASLPDFLAELTTNVPLLIAMVLVVMTIFINGATDAANAIAEAVGTRSISFRGAVILGVICNFLGLVISSLVTTAVAATVSGMVDFGGDSRAALVGLSAAMVSIVVWGGVAWLFGIPTSESHALIAGLSGAAIAVNGSLAGINGAEWIKVVFGLFFSTAFGFALGFVLTKLIREVFAFAPFGRMNRVFSHLQVVGAGFGAFMHGAQDGQKFMSIAMLAVTLATGYTMAPGDRYPMWLMVGCALMMSIGTAVGGKRIVKTVGTGIANIHKYQGAAASLSSGVSLLASTFWGLPVSTTHTKTASIMGAGAASNVKHVNWQVAKDMALTWVLTFPGCGVIGFVLAKVFMLVM